MENAIADWCLACGEPCYADETDDITFVDNPWCGQHGAHGSSAPLTEAQMKGVIYRPVQP